MPQIDILMATYNGAQYIDKQILSIQAQTYTNWRLIIHDDGSEDNTTNIVASFCKSDNRIVFVNDHHICRKAGSHFMYMLRFATAPFICFCDQDDIWLEDKLDCLLSVIQTKNNELPQVIFSNAFLFHSSTNLINGYLLSSKPHSLKEILFTNGGIHGSASMFNQCMKKNIDRNYSFISMHDHILTLAGCTIGQITYVERKLFLYRQHQHNVTGNMEVCFFNRFINAFDPSKKKPTLMLDTIKGVNAFLVAFEKELSEKNKSIINEYLSFPHMNILSIMWKVFRGGYSINNSRLHLLIKIITRKFISSK